MQPVDHPLDPEELTEYVDGEVSLERRADVESHLATCAACQKTVRDLRGVSRDLAAWSLEAAPNALRARVLFGKAGFGRQWPVRWIPSWATVPVLGLTALAALLIAVPLGRYSQAPAIDARSESRVSTVAEGAERSRAPSVTGRAGSTAEAPQTSQTSLGSRIIRTATLQLVPKDFDAARATVDRIVADAGGYLGTVVVSGTRATGRTLAATVNVPATRLDETVRAFRTLGEVVQDSQNATDVTERLVDLEARLANSRNSERRMNELLRTRTGTLTEVLEAEREVARVREEIERLDAQRKSLADKVTFSAITLQFDEPKKSSMDLGPLPLTTRIRNAFIEGLRSAFAGAVEALLVVLQVAPALLLWALLLGVPIWRIWRWRARVAA